MPFRERGSDYVRSLIEPLLSGPLGTIQVQSGEGFLTFTAPVNRSDAKRLEYKGFALNALVRTLAASHAAELPEGVSADCIYVKLAAPAERRRSKQGTPEGVFIGREALERPLGQLLAELGLIDEDAPAAEPSPPLASKEAPPATARKRKGGGKKPALRRRPSR
jgi:hypothetical protein